MRVQWRERMLAVSGAVLCTCSLYLWRRRRAAAAAAAAAAVAASRATADSRNDANATATTTTLLDTLPVHVDVDALAAAGWAAASAPVYYPPQLAVLLFVRTTTMAAAAEAAAEAVAKDTAAAVDVTAQPDTDAASAVCCDAVMLVCEGPLPRSNVAAAATTAASSTARDDGVTDASRFFASYLRHHPLLQHCCSTEAVTSSAATAATAAATTPAKNEDNTTHGRDTCATRGALTVVPLDDVLSPAAPAQADAHADTSATTTTTLQSSSSSVTSLPAAFTHAVVLPDTVLLCGRNDAYVSVLVVAVTAAQPTRSTGDDDEDSKSSVNKKSRGSSSSRIRTPSTQQQLLCAIARTFAARLHNASLVTADASSSSLSLSPPCALPRGAPAGVLSSVYRLQCTAGGVRVTLSVPATCRVCTPPPRTTTTTSTTASQRDDNDDAKNDDAVLVCVCSATTQCSDGEGATSHLDMTAALIALLGSVVTHTEGDDKQQHHVHNNDGSVAVAHGGGSSGSKSGSRHTTPPSPSLCVASGDDGSTATMTTHRRHMRSLYDHLVAASATRADAAAVCATWSLSQTALARQMHVIAVHTDEVATAREVSVVYTHPTAAVSFAVDVASGGVVYETVMSDKIHVCYYPAGVHMGTATTTTTRATHTRRTQAKDECSKDSCSCNCCCCCAAVSASLHDVRSALLYAPRITLQHLPTLPCTWERVAAPSPSPPPQQPTTRAASSSAVRRRGAAGGRGGLVGGGDASAAARHAMHDTSEADAVFLHNVRYHFTDWHDSKQPPPMCSVLTLGSVRGVQLCETKDGRRARTVVLPREADTSAVVLRCECEDGQGDEKDSAWSQCQSHFAALLDTLILDADAAMVAGGR